MSGRWGVGRSGVHGRGFAAMAVGLLLVAGCSGDDPPVTPEPTASVSAEPSPSVDVRVAPTRPAEWGQVDLRGAVAVAKYFMDLYGYAFASGDLEEWNKLSHSECVFCVDLRSAVDAAAVDGSHAEGGQIEVLSESGGVVSVGELYAVRFEVQQHASRLIAQDGTPRTQWSPDETAMLKVLVLREADAWKIRNVEVVSDP